jgi:glycosyltransferase involved in cell wall biosynthesis
VDRNVAIITGSVRGTNGAVQTRPIDLIFVGRFARIKQPEQFVEIVARLVVGSVVRTESDARPSRPALRAVMVGDGPELPSVRALIERLGLTRQIELLGQRADVHELLGQSKVFVLTSRSEGLSIALVEAMSCGVPGVVADVGELSDVIESGRNGWLVPPGDLDAFAGRIAQLLDDAQQWRSFSKAAQASAMELSGIDRVAQRWRACLEPICAAPSTFQNPSRERGDGAAC